MIIHACLLDVAAATIKPVTLDSANTLAGLCSLIGCSLVDFVNLGDGHTLYCDDEGLTDGLRGFTLLEGHAAPLAGNLVIAGTNAEGETTSITEPLETFAAMLTVVRPVLDPIFETVDMPGVFGSRVKTFSARLERSRPHIVGRCNAPDSV